MLWTVLAAGGALIVVASLIAVLRTSVADRNAFRQLCGVLGIAPARDSAVGERDGVEYTLAYGVRHRQHGAAEPYVRLTIYGRSRQRFRLVRTEDAGFFAKLTGGSPIETGDPLFDRSYRLSGRSAAEVKAFFASARPQYAARQLFDSGIRSLVLESRALEATWWGTRPGNLDPIQVRGAIGSLALLATALPGFLGTRTMATRASVKRRRSLLLLLPGALLITGMGTTAWGATNFPPLDFNALVLFSCRYSLPLLALFLLAFVLQLREVPFSRREIVLIVLSALLGFPTTGSGVTFLLNGVRDPGTASISSAEVLKKGQMGDAPHAQYTVHVKSWRRGRRQEVLDVSEDLYRRAVPGETKLLVVTKPGRLGFEWVERITELSH